jgi:hypothetical protein
VPAASATQVGAASQRKPGHCRRRAINTTGTVAAASSKPYTESTTVMLLFSG